MLMLIAGKNPAKEAPPQKTAAKPQRKLVAVTDSPW
jgi:hypothetical protein